MVNKAFESSWTVRYARWVTSNPYKVIFASVLAAVALASGGRFLGFSNDYRVFFGDDNPQLLAFEEVENLYTRADNVLFVVAPKSGEIFSRESLAAVQELTSRSWKIPYSTRVDSITNFQHTKAVGDDLFVDDLVGGDPESLTDEKISEIRRIALSEPILKDLLITEKSDVTGVSVSIQVPGKDPAEVIEVNQFARKLRADFKKDFPDVDLKISGVVALNNAFAESGQSDAQTITPLMYLIMIIIMAILLRSVAGTLASLGVIILSTAAAMGFAGYAGIALTPPSATAPTIILTLAIADSVHVLMSMILLMRKGWTQREALVESLRINFQAILLTSVTTVVGFLCLNFSDAPPFHDLGNITAFGVMVAWFFSITFLPALASVLKFRVKRQETDRNTERFDRFGLFIANHPKKVLGVSVGVAVLLISFIPKIDLNDEFVKWFDHRVEFRRDTEFMHERLTGIYNLQYSISAGESEGISSPEFMAKVGEYVDWWRAQPETIHVAAYTDIMKKLNQTMHADQKSWYRLPDDLELASQYLLLYEMSLPFGLDLNNQIDIDKSAIKLVVTTEEMTTTQARELSERGDRWLKDHTPGVMQSAATGPMVMFSHMSERNIMSMIKGTTLALILITILMMIALKSFKFGLISLLPNAIPALMAFGFWSILVGQVGMAISIVSSATLGIIVDDSVHFLTKFVRAQRENGSSTSEAIRYSFSTVGMALVTTSIILVIGFGILMYSSFLLNWSLGVLSAMTITFALLTDFFLLPALLLVLDRKGRGIQPQLEKKLA